MARNDFEWDAQRATLSAHVRHFDYGLKTDIVSCFASIPVARVIEDLERKATTSVTLITRLSDMLAQWDSAPDRRGLPQRSAASALLANMYLMNLDEVISHYNSDRTRRGRSKHASARWMDDIWVFGKREGRLRSLQVDLQDAARNLGLELHAAKTGMYQGSDLVDTALQSNHSAVDSGLIGSGTPQDLTPLEELLEKLIDDPEGADRSSVRFLCVRLRRHGLKTQATELLEHAKRMPHVADHLSRLANDLGLWKNYTSWYARYTDKNWARFDWSKAQFATMFPSKAKIDAPVVDALVNEFISSPELPLLAVCIQRLVRWSPDTARDLIRAAAKTADHPHERRLLALGALSLKEPRQSIRDLLGAYDENQVTLRVIEAANFRPLPVTPDFR